MLSLLALNQRATLKIDDVGLRMIVEEGRSIQGEHTSQPHLLIPRRSPVERFALPAEAFMHKGCFATYHFNLSPDSPSAYFEVTPDPNAHDVESESDRSTPTPADQEAGEDGTGRGKPRGPPHCEMSISLATMLECLNIFGNAGVTSANPFKRDGPDDDGPGGSRKRRRGDGDDDDGGGRRWGGRGETSADEKQTSLRLSYRGVGYPLVMLWVPSVHCKSEQRKRGADDLDRPERRGMNRLEESGIVTRCELTTYEPEGLLDLQFTAVEGVQKLIMKVRHRVRSLVSCGELTLSPNSRNG